MKSKVVVAMSGGVDSSVAAALLQEQGHEVIGMMLRLWSEPGKEGSNRCCTPESMALAKQVASQLDIPFYVVDAKEAFHASVVRFFLDGYARGETPNPCLECNRLIRWTLLLEHAVALGADAMATGHYARISTESGGRIVLRRAVDRRKDQSYVLHVLNQAQLRHACFPLGEYQKSEVRAIAARLALPAAARRESQDLCFLAGGNYRDFLSKHRPSMLMPGAVVDSAGNTVGDHGGLPNYTIGQRRGLRIVSTVPMYVIRKESASNRLVVGTREQLAADWLVTAHMNWISGNPPESPFRAQVKTRYTASEQEAEVLPIDGGKRVRIVFGQVQRGITPGQAAVLYAGDVVVGGGIIMEGGRAGT